MTSLTIEVDSADPAALAFQYHTVLGVPATQAPTGTLSLTLDNGAFAFVQQGGLGFSGLILHHGQHQALISIRGRALLLRIE
ncbi:MAG: hypothetical protein C7B45_11780 [Sulfobacillus acidophilus]|uniref:Uncharacterized protein n=1 Tax=Sulfobacillus acidophilus TaxID=53633 RepID=A0A2T2WG40_9FIRM|nr:MAG: hypothetical protein C7B45_11780 [Sulfobacillus acidophilus]